MVPRVKKYQPRKCGESCWARMLSRFREHNLQRKQGMQEGQTEKEEMRQQQRTRVMKDMTKKIRAKEEWSQTIVGG